MHQQFSVSATLNFIYDALYDVVQNNEPALREQMAVAPPVRAIDFTALVREIREARHITQEQLARELQVTFSTVNGWENGKHRPIPALAKRLVEIADTSRVPQARYTSSTRLSRHARRRTLK
jgi:DNA-binding transcriptional regulator YiaG